MLLLLLLCRAFQIFLCRLAEYFKPSSFMILNVPESPHPIIHQDVYTPSTTFGIAAPFPMPFPWNSALLTSARKTTGNATDSVEYRWREPSVWDSSVEGFDRARRFSAGLNMCTLLSLRRNNTRYLARDKCLSRRIPESTGAAAKLRISPEAGVSPHKDSTDCPFFLAPCLSDAWWVALCHIFYSRRECCHGMTPEDPYGSLWLMYFIE